MTQTRRLEMEEYLERIADWFVKGNLRQFETAVKQRLETDGYGVESNADGLLFYRVREQGGFLGIGKKTTREPVMKIDKGNNGVVQIPSDPLDPEFVRYLAAYLAER
jgi:hypothetical protein